MSAVAILSPSANRPVDSMSVGDELIGLGREINAHQHRVVHLAARFDEDLDWFRLGHRSASSWIASQLQIETSTAREWIRVGHALRSLPLIDEAFAANEISYAKARILTRWADDLHEVRLLELARDRVAGRLTAAIACELARGGETDAERELRLHEERSFTTWTDGDGLTVIRVVLAPSVAKPVVAAVDELVRRIAQTPIDVNGDEGCDTVESSGQACCDSVADGASDAPADAVDQPRVSDPSPDVVDDDPCEGVSLSGTLRTLRERWQPAEGDDWVIPSLAQQRADAFVVLLLEREIEVATEVVIHVRGDGITFDDGTPTTGHAVVRHLDDAFIRLLIHDAERRPINASGRQRHPTTRQQRVVMERHGHECVDCQSTDLLELDHTPDFRISQRTVIDELEPRCAPCHRARHRVDRAASNARRH